MRVKPILFNTEMVRAILDGRKTCTRRCVKPTQIIGLGGNKNISDNIPINFIKNKTKLFRPYCDMKDEELINVSYRPPYNVGDILYVRETWHKGLSRYMYRADYSDTEKFYKNGKEIKMKWKPSIHMPKEAARIFLKVTDVRVERLQKITEKECIKEGVYPSNCKNCSSTIGCDSCPDEGYCEVDEFVKIWNSTLKKTDCNTYSWDANPYVWVVKFERCDKPGKEQ